MRTAWRSAVCLAALSWIGASCSTTTNPAAAQLHCTGSQVHQAVDYPDSKGDTSPLAAVATYLSGPGRGLPNGEYVVDNTFQDQPAATDDPAPSTETSTPPREVQIVVHRTSVGVDVAVEVTDYGSGWQATSANFCAEAKR